MPLVLNYHRKEGKRQAFVINYNFATQLLYETSNIGPRSSTELRALLFRNRITSR